MTTIKRVKKFGEALTIPSTPASRLHDGTAEKQCRELLRLLIADLYARMVAARVPGATPLRASTLDVIRQVLKDQRVVLDVKSKKDRAAVKTLEHLSLPFAGGKH